MRDFFKIEGIVPKIIENGLKIWIRSKCLQVKGLEIKIKSNNINIINGNIKSIIAIAKDVNFTNIEIKNINLASTEINLEFSIKEKRLLIKNKFTVNGSLDFSSNGLTNSLSNKQWIWLGNKLTNDLIGMKNFKELKIKDDLIFLTGYNTLNRDLNIESFSIKALKGKIILFSKESEKELLIPMDENIYIKSLKLENDLLILQVISKVTP